jgi:hypothetical protein
MIKIARFIALGFLMVAVVGNVAIGDFLFAASTPALSARPFTPGIVVDRLLPMTPSETNSVSLANRATAFNYLTQEGGLSMSKVPSHINAIDLVRPVVITEIQPGTLLQQYVLPTRGPGNYFSPLGTTPLQAGLKLQGQQLGYFSNSMPVRSLQSFAAPDYLYPPGAIVPGSGAGGGIQYFVPNKGAFAPVSP